jgi:hypothetical protein
LDTLLRIKSVPNQAAPVTEQRQSFLPFSQSGIGIGNHSVCPSRYNTLEPAIDLFLGKGSILMRKFIGKRIPAVCDPGKPTFPC